MSSRSTSRSLPTQHSFTLNTDNVALFCFITFLEAFKLLGVTMYWPSEVDMPEEDDSEDEEDAAEEAADEENNVEDGDESESEDEEDALNKTNDRLRMKKRSKSLASRSIPLLSVALPMLSSSLKRTKKWTMKMTKKTLVMTRRKTRTSGLFKKTHSTPCKPQLKNSLRNSSNLH
jgi:hypothetical protein